jgi:hypothetical protein
MPIADTWNVTRPGQVGATGAINALHIEEYTGVLNGTIDRKSVIDPWVPRRQVKGTSVIQSKAIGESTLQVVTPGASIDGTKNKVGKNTLTIDTVIAARSVFPLLETWQADYDARAATGVEHGKKIAKFTDQAFFIQAIKAGLRTTTKYSGVDAAAGHYGGSQKTLAGANDHLDPAKLYAAIADLFVQMEQKDVDPRTDDVLIAVKPAEFYTLMQNEQLINTNYVTAAGNSVQTMVLKTYGVPVISSNNFMGGANVTTHELGADYLGDFTKVVAAAFSASALLAGETIPLTPQMYWNDDYLHWVVGAYTSFGVTVDQAQYAGVILKP